MTLREKIDVMKAYDEGKAIEWRYSTMTTKDTWYAVKEPVWNWVDHEYRVKPEKKEPNQEHSIDEMIKILNAYKEGKTIEYKYRREPFDSWSRINTQNPDWNWTIFEYRIANVQQTKKPRRMTNKELFKWLAQGNGAMRWSKHERAQLTTHFEYDEYQENYPVASGIIIRGFHEAEWHDPMIADDGM